jgi:phage tail sheath protein FI
VAEYLAPGVYVEETSFRAKSIEGVGTSTTAFAGPTARGPIDGTPELVTSFGDFERIYGGFENLELAGKDVLNYLAHSVRAYFDNGGSRLYVSRVFTPNAKDDTGLATSDPVVDGGDGKRARFVARFPGSSGNGGVTVRRVETAVTLRGLQAAPSGSLVGVRDAADGPLANFYVKDDNGVWTGGTDGKTKLDLSGLSPGAAPGKGANILTVAVTAADSEGREFTYEDLGLAPAHPRYAGQVLAVNPTNRADALQNPVAFAIDSPVTALDLNKAMFAAASTKTVPLSKGDDGAAPTAGDYAQALGRLVALEDISIVAAPGHSAYADFQAIQLELINHVETHSKYRIAVLDPPPGQLVSGVRDVRSRIDSKYAALYYPWVVASNPLARPGSPAPPEITLPPSGFVCGIYARTDVERGVFKAPANEVVSLALRFERDVNFAEQEVLNPLGVNCLRFFPDRGYRVWGARTVSSDPEWKYVNVRRYFNYLEASIDRGTQWAVFEPNGELLWANVRETVSSFLYNEWRSGALLGGSPEEAFFVRCDRSTMTQNDLDNGRLICLIGVAAIKPAEFVIFRIGQKTADAGT